MLRIVNMPMPLPVCLPSSSTRSASLFVVITSPRWVDCGAFYDGMFSSGEIIPPCIIQYKSDNDDAAKRAVGWKVIQPESFFIARMIIFWTDLGASYQIAPCSRYLAYFALLHLCSTQVTDQLKKNRIVHTNIFLNLLLASSRLQGQLGVPLSLRSGENFCLWTYCLIFLQLILTIPAVAMEIINVFIPKTRILFNPSFTIFRSPYCTENNGYFETITIKFIRNIFDKKTIYWTRIPRRIKLKYTTLRIPTPFHNIFIAPVIFLREHHSIEGIFLHGSDGMVKKTKYSARFFLKY